MKSRRRFLAAFMVIAAGAIFAIWQWHASDRPQIVRPSAPNGKPAIPPIDAPVVSSTSGGAIRPRPPEREDPRRQLLRTSRNYAQLVLDLAEAASAGDATAEYLTANALRYCDERLKVFQRRDGSAKSLGEVQARWSSRPAGFQQELNEVYERCHEFLENPADLEATSSWRTWLDKADAVGFPPAQSEKANDVRTSDLLKDSGNVSSGDIVPPTLGPARDHALAATSSGDPDSIFRMTNWVDGTTHSPEDYVDLTSAWTLLACQRGYDDCGSNSEWIRSVCNFDPQCVDVDNATDYLQRHLGSHFDEVQKLAERIGDAVDAKDLNAIAAFL